MKAKLIDFLEFVFCVTVIMLCVRGCVQAENDWLLEQDKIAQEKRAIASTLAKAGTHE